MRGFLLILALAVSAFAALNAGLYAADTTRVANLGAAVFCGLCAVYQWSVVVSQR